METRTIKPCGSVRAYGPRIMYLGMFGVLSAIPLHTLLERGHRICAVVVPASPLRRPTMTISHVEPEVPPPSDLPILNPSGCGTIVHMAGDAGIPVLEVGRLCASHTLSVLSSYRPDFICVSCFPRRLPTAMLEIPAYGCLNLHPSLLPAYRGPAPLFWIFRQGSRTTGVTVHHMNACLDAGDLLAREAFDLPDGITGDEVEHRCARIGGCLLTDVVCGLVQGTATGRPQSESESSYFAMPKTEDLVITSDRSARWAFNFTRGVGGRYRPIEIHTEGKVFRVRKAIGYAEHEVLGHAYCLDDGTLRVRCTPGVLQVSVE